MVHKIYEDFEEEPICVGLFLDVTKAFDIVLFHGLILKVKKIVAT